MSHPAVPDDRPRKVWIAPAISTLITPVLGFLALAFSVISQMVCDACSEAENRGYSASFYPAWTVLCCGLGLALVVLLASWVLTRRRPAAAIFLAVAAPATVFLAWVLFMALVDWP